MSRLTPEREKQIRALNGDHPHAQDLLAEIDALRETLAGCKGAMVTAQKALNEEGYNSNHGGPRARLFHWIAEIDKVITAQAEARPALREFWLHKLASVSAVGEAFRALPPHPDCADQWIHLKEIAANSATISSEEK